MPSGHAGTITIVCCLLYYYKYINLYTCVIIITIVSLQRIIDIHYYKYYLELSLYKKSLWNLLLVILFGFLLTLTFLFKIEKDIQKPIPDWVDKSMIPSINKKKNLNFFYKIEPHYSNYLDILIDKIKKTNIKFDAIVGIKTGGAIISDYISNKLNLTNYKIKIKKPYKYDHAIYKHLNLHVLKKKVKYEVEEGINDNLEGKNIILIDEFVATGITIYYAIKYLEEKKANIIKPYCISHDNKIHKDYDYYKIDYVMNEGIAIYPWGYDN